MPSFVRQLGWELRKLWRRPRTYLGLVVCLAFEILLAVLYQQPAAREEMVRHVWAVPAAIDVTDAFSAVGIALLLVAHTVLSLGPLFVALVASDLVATELEDGTLRLLLCRPVSRGHVLLQRLLVGAIYVIVLTIVVAAGALALGLLTANPGRLALVMPHDGVVGFFDFRTALARYAACVPLVAAGMLTLLILGLALSCLVARPGTAIAGTLAVFFGDYLIHLHPAFAGISPYTLATRLKSFQQVFNSEVPWLRLERNLGDLFWLDVALLVLAYGAFRRRSLRAR